MTLVAAVVAAALAVLLTFPGTVRIAPSPTPAAVATHPARRRDGLRWAWSLGAGLGAALFIGGSAAPVCGVLVGTAVWWWRGRLEPADERRSRERAARDLPTLVHLLGVSLRDGAAPAAAVRLACAALPGDGAARLVGVADRLELGADPATVWSGLRADPALAPLGRCLSRAHETGAPVAAAIDRLGVELEGEVRAAAESRARSVGVKAALPLGLCLLPSFLLLGIVPLAAGLLRDLTG